jgi:L-asparagine transporter-like permease
MLQEAVPALQPVAAIIILLYVGAYLVVSHMVAPSQGRV